jgi:hypothetical protein
VFPATHQHTLRLPLELRQHVRQALEHFNFQVVMKLLSAQQAIQIQVTHSVVTAMRPQLPLLRQLAQGSYATRATVTREHQYQFAAPMAALCRLLDVLYLLLAQLQIRSQLVTRHQIAPLPLLQRVAQQRAILDMKAHLWCQPVPVQMGILRSQAVMQLLLAQLQIRSQLVTLQLAPLPPLQQVAQQPATPLAPPTT